MLYQLQYAISLNNFMFKLIKWSSDLSISPQIRTRPIFSGIFKRKCILKKKNGDTLCIWGVETRKKSKPEYPGALSPGCQIPKNPNTRKTLLPKNPGPWKTLEPEKPEYSKNSPDAQKNPQAGKTWISDKSISKYQSKSGWTIIQ